MPYSMIEDVWHNGAPMQQTMLYAFPGARNVVYKIVSHVRDQHVHGGIKRTIWAVAKRGDKVEFRSKRHVLPPQYAPFREREAFEAAIKEVKEYLHVLYMMEAM